MSPTREGLALQSLKGAQDFLFPPLPCLTNPVPPLNILTFSSSEMLRPRTVLDVGATSWNFLGKSTLTQNENTDELLLIRISGIYLDLQLIKMMSYNFASTIWRTKYFKTCSLEGIPMYPTKAASFSVYSSYDCALSLLPAAFALEWCWLFVCHTTVSE